MSTNAKGFIGKDECSCGSSIMANGDQPLLWRLWRAIKAWESAMEYSGHDHLFERLAALEEEVSVLRAQLENRRSQTNRIN